MQPVSTLPSIGSDVGARRWPHCEARAWRGTLLAINDPRAWRCTLAFPGYPSQSQVDAHIARCAALGLDMADSVPVLWDFGTYCRVWWETASSIRPYAEDLADCLREHAAEERRRAAALAVWEAAEAERRAARYRVAV